MNRLAALTISLLSISVLGSAPACAARVGDWNNADRALGRQGKDLPGGVHKISFPRSDLEVTLDGTHFWAVQKPEQLARGLSSALELMHVKRHT